MSTEIIKRDLWAVHVEGPDDIYPQLNRASAEKSAAEINDSIEKSAISKNSELAPACKAVVIPSPLSEVEHWKCLAEESSEQINELRAQFKAAQEKVAVGYLYPVDFEKLQNEECCVDLYSVPVDCPDGESTVKLYAAPLPADHIPDAGKKVCAWAVIAENGNIRAWAGTRDHPTLKKLESQGCQVVQMVLSPATIKDSLTVGEVPPRITEQDAREIISSYALWRGTEYNSFMADKFAGYFTVSDAGRALLDKLNAGRPDHIAEAGKMMKHEQEFSDEEYACIRDAVDRLMSAVGNDVDGDQSECSLCSEFIDDLIEKVINPLGVKWAEGDDVCEYYALGSPVSDHIADHSVDANKMDPNTINRRAIEWMLSDDTGLSSKAICAHMLGLEPEDTSYPSDPTDLGRCLRLMELIPEWKPRIKEMANYGPGWAGQIEVWDELNNTMTNEVGIDWSKGKKAAETYKAMKLAQASGYRNDPAYECGFDKNGFVSWSTKNRDDADE